MQPRMATPSSIGLLLGAALSLVAPDVHADPQASAGLTIGAAGAGFDRKIWDKTAFHLGLHGDVLFGRDEATDFGVGPYVEILTNGFDELQLGGGLAILFPVIPTFPIVLSLGAYGRTGFEAFSPEPGLAGELFFGSRSYNFHANYVMSAGLIGQMRYGLGPSKETSILVGAQIDLAILSLPVVFLINAARGGSPATAPVRSAADP
jgi:hypothetical protein